MDDESSLRSSAVRGNFTSGRRPLALSSSVLKVPLVSGLDFGSTGLGLRGIVLCSWAKHFNLAVLLSPPRCINLGTGKFSAGSNLAMD